jgi:hypothetical protein
MASKGYWIKKIGEDRDDNDEMMPVTYEWCSLNPADIERDGQPNRYLFLVHFDGAAFLKISTYTYNDGTSMRVLYKPHASKINGKGQFIAPDPPSYVASILFFRCKHPLHGNFLPGRGPNDEPAFTQYDPEGNPSAFRLDSGGPEVTIQQDGTVQCDIKSSINSVQTHAMCVIAQKWYDNKRSFPDPKRYDHSRVTPEHFEEFDEDKCIMRDAPIHPPKP